MGGVFAMMGLLALASVVAPKVLTWETALNAVNIVLMTGHGVIHMFGE